MGNAHSSNLYSPTPWRERAAKRRSSLQIASDPCARLAQSPNILTGRIPWRERAAKRRSSLQTASVTCARLAPPANIFVYSSPVRKTIADTRKVQPLMNKNALPVQLLSQVFFAIFIGLGGIWMTGSAFARYKRRGTFLFNAGRAKAP